MLRRMNVHRWRRHLIASTTAITLAVLAGVAVYVYLAYQRAASELVIERDHQVTYLSAARLRDELLKFSDVLVVLARTPEIFGGNLVDQRAEMARAGSRLAVFDSGVVLLDNFGRVRVSEPPKPEIFQADWSDRDVFAELLKTSGPLFSNAFRDDPAGAFVVAVSVPVYGEYGEFTGALVGMFRLGEPRASSFYASIVRLRLGQEGSTFVVDGNGRIIYDSFHRRIGEVLTAGSLYGWGMPRAGWVGDQGDAVRLRDDSGRDIVAAYAPVPGTRWTLISEHDWDAMTATTRRYTRILLILLALGMTLPALGIGLLVREQNAEMIKRERTGQEARVAHLIQERLLPRQVPVLPGWSLATLYRPAAAARGNFHDFFLLPDGRLMLALADVTDTGLPAAHVMSTTRAALRGAANQGLSPCDALTYSNTLLCPEMNQEGHVACVYGILDPVTGRLQFANAGFNAPLFSHNGHDGDGGDPAAPAGAAGSPLGRRLDATYDQVEASIDAGEFVVFYSAGLINRHSERGEVFDPARLSAVLARPAEDAQEMVAALLAEVGHFAGGHQAQADDITVIVLGRMAKNGSATGSE